MSAYIVDPRTIDYLVEFARRHRSRRDSPSVYLSDEQAGRVGDLGLSHGLSGNRFYFGRVSADELGSILIAENIRSVRYRYPNDGPDDLPGPCDQSGVWRYSFKPIPHNDVKPAWVVRSCDCLRYQSCESLDWDKTLAAGILAGIRDEAVEALVGDNAPWGVTDDDLQPKPQTHV